MLASCYWSLRFPSPKRLKAFLASQATCDFTYSDVGATAGQTVPAGFIRDHHRALLGSGEGTFQAACAGLRRWSQFPRPWTKIFPADTPLNVGNTLAVVIRVFGVWRLNSSRIVYLIDETKPVRRFGFAYGTLPAHVELGEERFSVEIDAKGDVWYDIVAISKPKSPLVRLAYPIARRLQHKFSSESKTAMQAVVRSILEPAGPRP